MAGDMVVALGSATTTGTTLFGHNRHGLIREPAALQRVPGRSYALGETVRTQHLDIPQARQTFTVLGCQSAHTWGYHAGVNEHHVAIGQSGWQSRLAHEGLRLTGPDLVRLALERSRSARQALELITDLVARHGQGATPHGPPRDSVFLIADPREAYLVEAAGSYWAWLECRDLRAASDVGLIRQDWQRLVPGLAEHAFEEGWWPDDGSKLDFGCVNQEPLGRASALRRWGRASLLLEQQHGHIDAGFVRRLLSDHYERTKFEVDPLEPEGPRSICRHAAAADPSATVVSFLTELAADGLALAWCAFGSPCLSVYLPIFLDGEIPEVYQRLDPAVVPWHPHAWGDRLGAVPHRWSAWREALTRLQGRIDQETEEFVAEAGRLKRQGDRAGLHRQTTLFMQNHLEQLEAAFFRVDSAGRRPVFAST